MLVDGLRLDASLRGAQIQLPTWTVDTEIGRGCLSIQSTINYTSIVTLSFFYFNDVSTSHTLFLHSEAVRFSPCTPSTSGTWSSPVQQIQQWRALLIIVSRQKVWL